MGSSSFPMLSKLEILPATQDAELGLPDVMCMEAPQIRALKTGRKSKLYIQQPGGQPLALDLPEIPNAMMYAFFPAVKIAIDTNGPKDVVRQIALPPCESLGAKYLIKWAISCVDKGEILRLPTIKSLAAFCYRELYFLGLNLGAENVANQAQEKCNAILWPTRKGTTLLISKADLEHAAKLPKTHRFRRDLVDAVATALHTNRMWGKIKAEVWEYSQANPRFQEQVDAVRKQLKEKDDRKRKEVREAKKE